MNVTTCIVNIPVKLKKYLKIQEYTRNFGEIPPGLVMTGNDASSICASSAKEPERAKAGGLKIKVRKQTDL